jgi:hypothetical protein
MDNFQTIDMSTLAHVAGGQGGTFERLGGQAGQTLGQWGANQVQGPLRIPAQAVLPPAGQQLGSQAGRMVDNMMPWNWGR